MSRPSREQRKAARREVAVSEESKWDRHYRVTYQEWCAVNGMPELPTDADLSGELVLLRYLHSTAMARGWTHKACQDAARLVARHLQLNGLADPRGPRVIAWLKARLRETGKRTTRPIDALTPSEVRNHLSARHAEEQEPAKDAVGDGELRHMRAFLALVDLLEESELLVLNPLRSADPHRTNRQNPAFRTLAALTGEDFTMRSEEIRVHVAGQTLVVSKARTPEHHAMLTAAVFAGGPHPLHPVAPDDDQARRLFLRRFQRKAIAAIYRVAGKRTHRDPQQREWAAQWWANAEREHRVRVMMLLDATLPRRAQDAAFLLLGLTALFRNAELVRLNIGHMARRPDGTGFDYCLEEHKSALHAARHGSVARPLVGSLEHELGAESCPPICAACAMDRHLQLRAWYGATPQDPLFVDYNSRCDGGLQRLSSLSYGARVVKQAAGAEPLLEDGSNRRLGTRTLRVTGATWLHGDGVSYEELREVGSWSSALYARLYVRRYDPWALRDLVLGLNEGSRPSR